MALVPPKLACDNNLGLSVSRKPDRQPRASGLAGSGRYTVQKPMLSFPGSRQPTIAKRPT